MNKNRDDFSKVEMDEGEFWRKLKDLVIKHQDKPISNVLKIDPEDGDLIINGRKASTWGPPPIRAIMKDLIYLDMLERANASLFFHHHAHRMTEDERRDFMEKYGVEIDKEKVEKEKRAGKGDRADDPNVNVPMDPEKGTEPYEKRPEDDAQG